MHRIALLLSVGLLVGGCSSGSKAPDPRAPSAGTQDLLAPGQYPEVVFQDQLDQSLVIHEPPNVRAATDSMPMLVRLTLRSISDDEVNVKVRFIFYAADGSKVTDNPVWQPHNILPRSREYIEGNSIALNAVRWEAQIVRN